MTTIRAICQWPKVSANGCPEGPTTVKLPDKAGGGTSITRKTCGPGKEGAAAVPLSRMVHKGP